MDVFLQNSKDHIERIFNINFLRYLLGEIIMMFGKSRPAFEDNMWRP